MKLRQILGVLGAVALVGGTALFSDPAFAQSNSIAQKALKVANKATKKNKQQDVAINTLKNQDKLDQGRIDGLFNTMVQGLGFLGVNVVVGPDGKVVIEPGSGGTGAAGATGATGATGPQGPAGDTGPAGLQGEKGDKGDQGDPGVAGPAGETGAVGAAGPAGDQGPQGPAGPAGPQGAQGPQGPAGQPGAQGPQGPAGPHGATGPQGAPGQQGAQGPQGPVGPQGPRGETGPRGPGASCQIANCSGYGSSWTDPGYGNSWAQIFYHCPDDHPILNKVTVYGYHPSGFDIMSDIFYKDTQYNWVRCCQLVCN